jgi:uncharacterized PurR-regulated membrane protein YhhQ (DUF165 family)
VVFTETLLLITKEFAIDFGIFLRWGKTTFPYFLPVTDVFQLNHIVMKCSRVSCV